MKLWNQKVWVFEAVGIVTVLILEIVVGILN